MNFNTWYEGYERDGGELMLFNTIDLESAYKAGMLRAAEICKSKHENMDSRLNYVAGWIDAEAAIRKEAENGST